MSKPFEITIERGEDYMPTFLRVNFCERTWNLAFRGYPHMPMRDADRDRFEARDAIRTFIYMLEREMMRCLPEDLK